MDRTRGRSSQERSATRASDPYDFEKGVRAWRKEYGRLKVDQAKRFKELEQENARLKRLLAEAELDNAILREAARPNF